ncbi:hypothetical protein BKA70DRAFT_1280437 [Coprinopsis sp. MPI-PUGE-AT-0042]|nr:hypothetical protein BKA70DRAFT_1280437 [Coprinopsis sp. MPI-PUGE-AT-0042]
MVDKAFQERSERLLYNNISTDPLARLKWKGDAGPLEILSKSSQRASYLRTLSIRFSMPANQDPWYAETLACVLGNATALVDLRIAGHFPSKAAADVVLKAIQEGPFSLEILFVPWSIPLTEIIPHCPPMKAAGVSNSPGLRDLLSQIGRLANPPDILLNSERGQRIQFILGNFSSPHLNDHIALQRQLERLLLPDSLIGAFGARRSILGIGVFTDDFSTPNLTIMIHLLQALKEIYALATILELHFVSPDGLTNDETAAALMALDGLQEIYLTKWSRSSADGEYTQERWRIPLNIAEECLSKWRAACPRLRFVSFTPGLYASTATGWEIHELM